MKRLLITVLAAVLVLTAGLFTSCGQQGEAEQKVAQAGTSMFENINTTDLSGAAFTQKDLAGKKLTLVNVWATWCNPCLSELPDLNELAEEYKDSRDIAIKGLLIETEEKTGAINIGLSDKERQTAETILKETGAQYQQLLVSESMKAGAEQIQGFPTTFFVDKEGNLVGEPIMGAQSKDVWKQTIQERLELLGKD